MKRTSQSSVLTFFSKKQKTEESASTSTTESSSHSILKCDKDLPSPGDITDCISFENDVGKYVQLPLNDEVKLKVLTKAWIPPLTYKFPVSGKRNLSFQRHWMDEYSWLVFSDVLKGALCKTCVLFGRRNGGRGQQKLASLVLVPFTNWRKAKMVFDNHNNTNYHKFSIEQAEGFLSVMTGKTQDVVITMSLESKKIAEENRKKLIAIVETIIMCGRQELALRGKHDSGIVGITEPLHNDGNFRAILRFRARCGDDTLKKHLLSQSSDSRAMFMSPTIQNELIEICGNVIQEGLIKRIKNAGFFTVLADETQDISRHEQLALCVRYVDYCSEKAVIREDFLEFVHVEDVTASALANTIMQHLSAHGLDLNMLVGQGYDGAAVISGRLKGVRTIICEKFPKAQFVHCAAHTLNLVLAHSCEIPMIRNCIGTVKSIVNFFRQSGMRDGLLTKAAETAGASHSNLLSLCETRWTEKHLAIERFAEMYSVIIETLQVLQEKRKECGAQAYQLQQAMESSQFVVSLLVLRKVFTYTSNLNKALQAVNIDLVETCKYVDTVRETLVAIRNDDKFSEIIKDAKSLIEPGILTAPRVTTRQTKRGNVPADTPEMYYKRNVFYPFLDHVISELAARFSQHHSKIGNLRLLLPNFVKINPTDELREIQAMYLPDERLEILHSEYELWQKKWSGLKSNDKPNSAIEAFEKCEELFYPQIKKLLKILATLPVSTAAAERSFSTLKRLKNYLRNTMGQERLTGLALLSIFRDIAIQPTEIVNRLAQRRHRLNILL